MKIEQLLVQYLYDSKKLTLQGIGTFHMSEDFVMPSENDKDFVIPDNAISFEYNSKAGEDHALVTYIVQQTRKIFPLASADLDSYVVLGKQFLNIGKPFRIEGIGTLQKNMAGKYDFVPGQFITPKLTDIPKPLKEKLEHDISFDTPTREESRSGNSKKIIMIISAVIVLGVAGFAAWYFLNRKKNAPAAEENTVAVVPAAKEPEHKADSSITKDSSLTNIKKPDTVIAKAPVISNNSAYTFRVVFRTYNNKTAAQKKYDELTSWGYHLLLLNRDTTLYKIAMPFARPLADTVKLRDSVRVLFGDKPYVEIN